MEDDDVPQSADIISFDENGIPVYRELLVPDLLDTSQLIDGDGPRLMITHIVNENFKSYAGVKTLGPFNKNFTAIIGPNGSGKSNVIDSMLFVFGYRASKIRSKKISVLIHNSEAHTDVESCTVAVHFQRIYDEGAGDDEFKVVEDSQFVVSRTAFRDSSSYYKINNRKAHFKEVDSFLKKVGVDLVHNRFLILQGEVEQIAMMKPKAQNKNEDGMLEFLEDIIGSNRYTELIEVLAKRIEELAEMKSEKYTRVKIIEKEKNELEDAKNEAVAYLELENNITQKKSIILQKEISLLEKLYKETVDKKASAEEEMSSSDKKLQETTAMKKAIAKEYKEIIKKYHEADVWHEKVNREFNEYEQRDVRCREDLNHCRVHEKTLAKSLQQEEVKLTQYKLIPGKKEEEAKKLTERLNKLQTDKEKEEGKFNEVLNSFQDETKDLQQKKEKKEQVLSEHQKSVNAAKQQYQLEQAKLDLMKSNHSKESTKLADIKRNMEKMQNIMKEKNSSLEEVNQKLPECKEALERSKKDLLDLNKVFSEKEEKAKELRLKVEVARSSYQSAQNQGRVLEFMMDLKRSAQIAGIHGRLGDLGAIDEKYDIAVSTACGFLDHIVVDNMDTAQRCIEALKANSVGQANFIGLDHMAKWKEFCSKKFSPPENVARLFDLITVKNTNVLPAFYFGLRDTLVARDLDQATRIAYGSTRYRVVTMNGQLIDLSGTMSGGGNKVIRGKMGSKLVEETNPKDLENNERELEKYSREMEACLENRYRLQEVVEKMQRSHREMQHSLQKLSNEIKNIDEQCSSFEKQLQDQEDAVAASIPDENKLQEMENKVVKLKKNYEELQRVASDLEDEIHEIHKQIMEIGGRELKSIETRISLLNTEIDQLSNALTEATVTIKTAQRNSIKSEAKIEGLKNEITANNEKINSLKEEITKIERLAATLLAEINQSGEDKKKNEALLSSVSAETSRFEEEEQDLKKLLIQLKHKLEKITAEELERKERKDELKRHFSELSLNAINEGDNVELKIFSEEELEGYDTDQIKYSMTTLQSNLSNLRPNMAAITEFKKKEELYLKRVSEMTQVSNLKDQQRKHFDDLRKKRHDEFMAGFGVITNKLKEMYQMITLGGDAELELVDSLNPFSEGVVFSVRPPQKSWKNISNLSGGEKTLSSLALVFALHHYKPTPFYVMDEIDAALDFRNVSIVAHYIKDRTKNAQFIVISLRNNMYELCDRLLGIYKTHNCTDSVIINPKTFGKSNEK